MKRIRLAFASPLLLACTGAAATLVGCAASTPPPASSTSLASSKPAPASVSADFVDLSSLRLRLHNVPAQAWRLLEPHWSTVPEYQRGALQAALLGMFNEKKLTPAAVRHLEAAVAADPVLAATTLQWLRSPIGYEVKFVEATATRTERPGHDEFLEKYAEVSDNTSPEVRLTRIRALAEATDAVTTTLDLTQAVGMATAALVNASRPEEDRLSDAELAAVVRRERSAPEVAKTYQPVVLAALLYRYRDLSLPELDDYLAFVRSDAGRWYSRVVAEAVLESVRSASSNPGEALVAKAGTDPVFDPEEMLLALPSGRQVRLLGMSGTQLGENPAVILRYETFLTLKDGGPVRSEADEVWGKVRHDLEATGTAAVVLQATGSVVGWVFPAASTRSYAWRRGRDGAWTLIGAAAGGGSLEGVEHETLWSLPP